MREHRDDNIYADIIPEKCRCGTEARVRYRIPVFWVECRKKCGMKTGYHCDGAEPYDPEAKNAAVKEWNRMVSEKS